MSDAFYSSAVLYVTDCSEPPEREVVCRYLDPNLITYADSHPEERNALLWSRLLFLTLPYLSGPERPLPMEFYDDFTGNLTVKSSLYRYCQVDSTRRWVAAVLSMFPVYLSIKPFSLGETDTELVRLRLPAIFNNWIDRQEEPQMAFYKLWSLQECLRKRADPTVRMHIADDDSLTVRGTTVLLRETFQFWTSDHWICAVEGLGLTTLLSELCSPAEIIGWVTKYAAPFSEAQRSHTLL